MPVVMQYNQNTMEEEFFAEMNEVLVASSGIKIAVSENSDGSLRIRTYTKRGSTWSDVAIIRMSGGNAFDLDAEGNAAYNNANQRERPSPQLSLD